jgi:hypothetical protein
MTSEKDLQNAGAWIQKHAKVLIIVLFGYLLIGTPIGASLVGLGTVNPGFPGAQAACYGVNFKDFGTDWTGTNKLHAISDAETTLASQGNNRISWGAGTGPTAMTCVLDYPYTLAQQMAQRQIATEIQGQIPLASFNYQNSTPLTLSSVPNWDQGEILQYWNVQPTSQVNQTLSNGTILNTVTYTETSQSLLLIPGNFYLDLYIPPSQYNPGTDSGWQEGTWSQVDFWYVLYWYEWLNAYGPVLKSSETPPQIPANALNRQEQFNLRGGFPIAGWIQGYQIPFQTQSGTIYDAVTATPASGGSTQAPIPASTKNNIMAQVQLSPSLTGRQVVLYTQPGDSYSLPLWTLPSGSIDNASEFASAQGLSQSPDFQTVLPSEYFKIGVQTLGTVPEGNFFTGYTIYYPSVQYLMRFIFGVYGVHTFVWDVQTASNLGYNATPNYLVPPAQWETRTVISATTPGLFTGLLDWFANPLNALQFYFVLIIIVILVVTVLNPGMWAAILHNKKED